MVIANMFDSLSPPKYTTTPTTKRAAELANSYNTNSNRRDKVSNVSPNVARLDNSSLEIIQAELKAIKSKLHNVMSQPKPKPKPQKKPKHWGPTQGDLKMLWIQLFCHISLMPKR